MMNESTRFLTIRQVAATGILPLFPAPGGVPFSLAVIIVYYT